MTLQNRVLFAEAIVTRSLWERIHVLFPEKAQSILSILRKITWGEDLLTAWENSEAFHEIWDALREKVDEDVTPLHSVFSRLSLNQKESQPFYYTPQPWKEPVYNPVQDKPTREMLRKHWENIAIAWIAFLQNCPEDPHSRLTHFVDWMERWLSAVPANQHLSDHSLSDHLRTMAAIASASNGANDLQIVLGDLSGIQSYLFDIAHSGAGGVAKRLRARSFILGLMGETAAHRLIQEAEVPLVNLLLSAGGTFYALLPSSFDVQTWQVKLEEGLYKRYHGTIRLDCTALTVPLNRLRDNFEQVLADLHQQIQAAKARPFRHVLQGNRWHQDRLMHVMDWEEEPCYSCRRFPKKQGDEEFCEFCRLDEEIGRLLPKTRYLCFTNGKAKISLWGDFGVEPRENWPADEERYYLIQAWNQAELKGLSVPIQRKWMANYVPVAPAGGCPHCLQTHHPDPIREGQPLSFLCIAHQSEGKELVGYLKGDVDNLGMLLSIGLVDDRKEQVYSLSQLATVSRLLERFFAGGINRLLTENYPHAYTVFSGGDDFFLVGPWDEILSCAADLRKRFQEYVADNPDVTLSAGISLVKPATPLALAAREVEDRLEEAKENPNRIRKRRERESASGRNQVTVRGQTMEWDQLEEVVAVARQLADWHKQQKISSGFYRHLQTCGQMYRSYKDEGNMESLRFVPMFTYYIQRNIEETDTKERKKRDVVEWAQRLLNIGEEVADLRWGYMKTIVEIAQLFSKERR